MTPKEQNSAAGQVAHNDPLAPEAGAPPPKRAYRRPELTTYGLVKELTRSATGTVGDGKGMNMAASDPLLKERVTRVGEHPLGFGLYLFDYKPEFRDAFGHGRQFGVMADEVERVCPEAVARDKAGYRLVDHARLGMTLARS